MNPPPTRNPIFTLMGQGNATPSDAAPNSIASLAYIRWFGEVQQAIEDLQISGGGDGIISYA